MHQETSEVYHDHSSRNPRTGASSTRSISFDTFTANQTAGCRTSRLCAGSLTVALSSICRAANGIVFPTTRTATWPIWSCASWVLINAVPFAGWLTGSVCRCRSMARIFTARRNGSGKEAEAARLAAAKLEDARAIWNEAEPLLTTPAEAYLVHRLGGRPVPHPIVRSAQLRFHRSPLSHTLKERMPESSNWRAHCANDRSPIRRLRGNSKDISEVSELWPV